MKKPTKQWLRASGIRAMKTVCQTAIATIGASTVMQAVNWPVVISSSILAGVVSLLTSAAGLPEVKDE